MTNKFKPGEWAILRNNDGGRLFQIHSVLPSGELTEVSAILSQQKYATKWHSRFFIKVSSKDIAVRMVEAFHAAKEIYHDAVAAAKCDFTRKVNDVIEKYAVKDE
jgi:hypothetical protein